MDVKTVNLIPCTQKSYENGKEIIGYREFFSNFPHIMINEKNENCKSIV